MNPPWVAMMPPRRRSNRIGPGLRALKIVSGRATVMTLLSSRQKDTRLATTIADRGRREVAGLALLLLRRNRYDVRRPIPLFNAIARINAILQAMAERGRQMLREVYNAPLAKIDLIAHGIPDVGFVDPTYFKDRSV